MGYIIQEYRPRPARSLSQLLEWSDFVYKSRHNNPDNIGVSGVFMDVRDVLIDADIRFAVAGGIAYSLLVESRTTEDVDIILLTANVDAATKALADAGFRFLHAGPFTDMPGWGVVKFDADDEIDIDLMHSDGIFVKKVFEHSIYSETMKINIIPPEALIVLKKLAYVNRTKSANQNTRRKGKRDKLDYESLIQEKKWDPSILKEFADLTKYSDEIAQDVKSILAGQDIP